MKFYQLAIEDNKAERLKDFFKVKTNGELRGAIQTLFDKITDSLLAEAYEIKGGKDERPKENGLG